MKSTGEIENELEGVGSTLRWMRLGGKAEVMASIIVSEKKKEQHRESARGNKAIALTRHPNCLCVIGLKSGPNIPSGFCSRTQQR